MQPIQNPATLPWGLTLSDKDCAALKGGCRIWDMDDRWAFVAMKDQELSDKLSPENKEPADEVPTAQEVMTDDELFEELEEEEDWVSEKRAGKAPPAKIITEEDMAYGGYISIRRSWSNTELYRLVRAVRHEEGGIND